MATNNVIQFHLSTRQWQLWGLLMLLLPSQLQAAAVVIENASTRLQNGVYQLNADINYELSDEVLEALNNGIKISMQITVRVEQPRSYLWSQLIVEKSLQYRLKYHALTGQYIVESGSDNQRSYLSLGSALRALGQIRAVPLLDKKQLADPQGVVVRIKSELDTDALPAPLRPVTWLSSQWQLSSKWFTCPLKY